MYYRKKNQEKVVKKQIEAEKKEKINYAYVLSRSLILFLYL